MTGNTTDLQYIISILNSKLGGHLVKCYVSQLQNRQFRMLYQSVINFPIPSMSISDNKSLEIIGLLQAKQYRDIDTLVYQLYGLSEEEIEFIESQ
jgi:hypothetical protein